MLYYLDYKHISWDYPTGDFPGREDFINEYRCPYTSESEILLESGSHGLYGEGSVIENCWCVDMVRIEELHRKRDKERWARREREIAFDKVKRTAINNLKRTVKEQRKLNAQYNREMRQKKLKEKNE